ncbi:MAG TPA: hypothetical protein PKX07_13095 [Aggregatilineales bacterium]|nr:hypothetical protein [Aggregatilineales bacterium]
MRRSVVIITLIALLLTGSLITAAQAVTLNGFTVSFTGRAYNSSTDRTTFSYVVSGTNTPPDLSHFDLEIPVCADALQVVAYAPTAAVSFGTDPTTGVNGIKWDVPLKVNESRVYAVTLAGNVALGQVTAAVKGGPGFESGLIPGPACVEPAVEVVKSVSVDGGVSWNDAELPSGPSVEVGAPVSFLFQVINTGDFPLTNISLTDSVLDLSTCVIPASLDVDGSFDCVVGPLTATAGQHVNIASVTASANGETVSDSDSAHYFGGDLPVLTVEKLVAVAGSGTWFAADSAPGLSLISEQQIQYRIVISNDGTVPFTNLTLTDDRVDASACALPAALNPGESYECLLGPFDIVAGTQTNTVTVTGLALGQTFTVSDAAVYTFEEQDSDVIIIIEGPIEQINGSVIIIFGVEITLADDDPMITVIQIGDIVHVAGEMIENNNIVVIIPITIVIVNVDVYVVDTQVWRDDNECGNPPPPWAPAHGWRRKCGGGSFIIEIGVGKSKGKKNK